MTKEEERLLFVNICSRTPYGIIVRNIKLNFDGYVMSPSNYQPLCVLTYDLHGVEDQGFSPIEDIRPYLRPLSSMTDEEHGRYMEFIEWSYNDYTGTTTICINKELLYEYLDFIYKHHLDDNNFIEKGLALKAPEGMYK